mmetsp:Transcript_17642/g.21632  ORF Transcript_17642/g.21632 Transcript_17642/m.21632 type:complete len:82 (+) Transcript_17642:580-825(+)
MARNRQPKYPNTSSSLSLRDDNNERHTSLNFANAKRSGIGGQCSSASLFSQQHLYMQLYRTQNPHCQLRLRNHPGHTPTLR